MGNGKLIGRGHLIMSKWRRVLVSHLRHIAVGLTASILALVVGCAAIPSVRGVDEVSINLLADSDFYLELENQSDADARPGKLAGELAVEGAKDCSDPSNPTLSVFMAPFCALVGATAGAVSGAAITAATTVAEDKAVALRQESRAASAREHWRKTLLTNLESAGRNRGKRIVPYPEGETVHVYLEDLRWTITPGDSVSILGTFTLAVRAGDDFARKTFDVSSARHYIGRWLADGGALIPQELELFWRKASERIWEVVDG